MKILREGERGCRMGPAEWFTGTVWIDEVVIADAPARLGSARVMFAPGARTAWHTHPVGQALHVLSGSGWVQKKGEHPIAIKAGDSVWIAPAEVHWHGASAKHTMVHLAMQERDDAGEAVVWGHHVTELEYLSAK